MRVTSPFRSEPSTELVLHGLHGHLATCQLLQGCAFIYLLAYIYQIFNDSSTIPASVRYSDCLGSPAAVLLYIMGGELASQSEQPVKIRHLSLDSRTFWVWDDWRVPVDLFSIPTFELHVDLWILMLT